MKRENCVEKNYYLTIGPSKNFLSHIGMAEPIPVNTGAVWFHRVRYFQLFVTIKPGFHKANFDHDNDQF